MDEKYRRPVRFPGQRLLQPGDTLRAIHTLAFSCGDRIECDQAHRVVFDDVVKQVSGPGQIREVTKRGPQRVMPVAIAGNQQQRRFQVGQNLAQVRILLRQAVVHAVARVDHHVDTLPVDIGDASPQVLGAARACGLVR